ncbi:hypothetical protein [Sphingobacterium bovistauri]|uniref:Tetratricopeptide repeat-containing protein n=1 Tax=Sphingobacterium bovistauri TaxID=2781959 RepID=A0ABS7Z7L1_9SPHI|nr:hypothetical protein [Sphingobacterium bovistauri]MCA5006181.1 hypothetical protein [Sphingobacterium bovistauri]
MTAVEFEQSLTQHIPPLELSLPLQSLWWDAKGNWKKAHDLIDHLEDLKSAHIHAYLHRKEGDLWNALYWYNRAKQFEFQGELEEEWKSLLDKYI